MSLSSILTSREGRAFFAQHVTRPRAFERPALMVPPMGANPARVGNAFDYAVRFGLQCRGLGQIRELVADGAVALLKFFKPDLWPNASALLEEAKLAVAAMSPDRGLSERAARACYALGGLDVVFRAKAVDQVGRATTDQEIAELRALYDIVHWGALVGGRRLILNPSFGEGTRLLRGADADLIRDDEVIDIKTSKYMNLDAKMIRQVVSYAILNNRFGISGIETQAPVLSCAVYFARAGELRRFTLDEVCSPSSQAAILAWFEARRAPRVEFGREQRLRVRLRAVGEAR